jgi:hypothetical protein
MDKVSPEPNTGCWLWLGAPVDWKGYGRFYRDGAAVLAHRAAWGLFRGEPADLRVLHKCDNPACVNPDHLFLGTQLDNIRDRDAKGRWNTSAANEASTRMWRSRTHCPRGHAFTPENTRSKRGHVKLCRECCRLDGRARREALAAAAPTKKRGIA